MKIDPYNPPRWIYMYEVTHSSVDTVKVGDVLIDRRRNLEHYWEFLTPSTGETTSISGVRRERLCSECYAMPDRWPRPFGHEGKHGESAPRLDRERSMLAAAD